MTKTPLPPALLTDLVDGLPLAVFVYRGARLQLVNRAGRRLVERVRSAYNIELLVMLADHLALLADQPATGVPSVALLTATNGEPFYVRAIPLGQSREVLGVTVRELGSEMDGFRLRYHLSPRESEVARLVLRGFSNQDIARALGMTVATAKKHLTHVFDKVGVDSRAQLASLLA